MQVMDEVEKTYKERYMKQEEEIEELRTVSNKFKYELSFLKSEYEHERIECQRILEECRLKHEAEVIYMVWIELFTTIIKLRIWVISQKLVKFDNSLTIPKA